MTMAMTSVTGSNLAALLGRKTLPLSSHLTQDADFQRALTSPGEGRLELDTKAVTGLAGVPTPVTGTAAGAPPSLRDLMREWPIKGGAVEFLVEIGAAPDLPAPVTAGSLKPELVVEYKFAQRAAQKSAAYLKVTTEALDDGQGMAATIESQLLARLLAAEEKLLAAQLLAPAVTGADIPTFTGAAGEPILIAAVRAAAELGAAGVRPTGILLSWSDWSSMITYPGTAGGYPFLSAGYLPPILPTAGLAAGTALTGDFSQAGWGRVKKMIVAVGEEADDLLRNRKTAVAELRSVAFVLRPSSFRKVTATA